jgi:hypothetical protein
MVLSSLREVPSEQPDGDAAAIQATAATPPMRTPRRWLCCAAPPPSHAHATLGARVRNASPAAELCEKLRPFTDMAKYQVLHAALEKRKQHIERQASRSHVRGDPSVMAPLLRLAPRPPAAQSRIPSLVRVHQHEADLIPGLVALLRSEPPPSRTVAICGMPGLGKTTIARAVFEEL